VSPSASFLTSTSSKLRDVGLERRSQVRERTSQAITRHFCHTTMYKQTMLTASMPTLIFAVSVVDLLGYLWQSPRPFSVVSAECLENRELNAEFEILNGGPVPSEGSCCMFDISGLTCPNEVPRPDYGKSKHSLHVPLYNCLN
jgi:hypothetical protein